MTNNKKEPKLKAYELIVHCDGDIPESIFYFNARDMLQNASDVKVLDEPAGYNDNTGKYEIDGNTIQLLIDKKRIITDRKSLPKLTSILSGLGDEVKLREVRN